MGAAAEKIERMRAALTHRQPDRIPAGEFFWTGFLNRCKAHWGPDFDPYRHWDLDYIVVMPNMDPKIQQFEILCQGGEDITLKTGFGATIRRSGDKPMPHFEAFSVSEPEQMADFALDPPDDPRRFRMAGDDQLNGVGDALGRDIPAWVERLDSYAEDLAIFGGVCEVYEYLWRIVGSENALVWLALEPDRLAAFVARLGEWLVAHTAAQIEAGAGRLAGMYIWGDVAYRNCMFFNPDLWRRLFKPHVKALIDLCHRHGLMVVYHGCGNARVIFDDFVEIGLDGYNPLEAKADLDVVKLKEQYGGRLAFVGNIDVRVLEKGDPAAIRQEVQYKSQAGQGGGWVFQSDHSVSSGVAPESYDLALRTLRDPGAR